MIVRTFVSNQSKETFLTLLLDESDHALRLVSCETLSVVALLEFPKIGSPSLLCNGGDGAFLTRGRGTGAPSVSSSNAAIFAAGSDGQVCSWLVADLAQSGGKPKSVEPTGTTKVGSGKVGLYHFNCKRAALLSEGGESGAGAEEVASGAHCACHGYCFGQDGVLTILRLIDGSGALKLEGSNQGEVLARLKYCELNLAKEKKISLHCEFIADDVFGFAVTTKQTKNQRVRLQFSQISASREGNFELKSLQPFLVEENLRRRAAAIATKSPNNKAKGDSEFKVYALASTGGGRLAIGTNFGIAALSASFGAGASRNLVLSHHPRTESNATAATVLQILDRTSVRFVQIAREAAEEGKERVEKPTLLRVAFKATALGPKQDLGIDLVDARMEISAGGRFVSGHSKATKALGVYALAFDGAGGARLEALTMDSRLGEGVHHFAWSSHDDTRCICWTPSLGPQCLTITASQDTSGIGLLIEGEAVPTKISGGNFENLASLATGPCVTALAGDENALAFLSSRRENVASGRENFKTIVGKNLAGVDLSGCAFIEWSKPSQRGEIECSFCALGYANALVVLMHRRRLASLHQSEDGDQSRDTEGDEEEEVSHVGSLAIDSPLGSLWVGQSLLVGTPRDLWVAHFAPFMAPVAAAPQTLPLEMAPAQGLIQFERLTTDLVGFAADLRSLCTGNYRLLSYSQGRIWCETDCGQIFTFEVPSLLETLKLEVHGQFSEALAAAATSLSNQDKRSLFNFVGKKGLMEILPVMLTHAPSKVHQVWGLFAQNKTKGLQLALHYIQANLDHETRSGGRMTMRALSSIDALLGAASEMCSLLGTNEAREKVEACLSQVRSHSNCTKPLAEAISERFGTRESAQGIVVSSFVRAFQASSAAGILLE